MSKYDVIPQEVRAYYEQKIKESGIKRVPGHWPVLMTKKEVDRHFSMMECIRKKGENAKNE